MFLRRLTRSAAFFGAAASLLGIACTQMHPAPLLPPPHANPQATSSTVAIPIPPPPADDTHPLDSLRWPQVQEETLPSGVTLRLVNAPVVPLIHLRIAFPVGRGADGDHPGVARLTALTLLEGALGADAPTRRTSGLEQFATPDVTVSSDATIFEMTMTSGDATGAVDHLHDMFVTPGFRLPAFLRAQQAAPRMIASDRSDMGVEEALWGTTAREDEKALAGIKAWHCRAFHKASYDPHRAIVVWVGDISLEQARAFTERIIEGWKSLPVKQPAPTTKQAPRKTAAELTPTNPGKVHIAAVANGPAWDSEDWPALWLVAQTMTKTCPALPWADSVASFRICDTIASSGIDEWMKAVESQLAALGNQGLESSALEAAKRSLVESEARRLSRPSALADTLVRWTPSEVDAVGDRIRSVDDVRGAVSRHLQAENLRYVVVEASKN